MKNVFHRLIIMLFLVGILVPVLTLNFATVANAQTPLTIYNESDDQPITNPTNFTITDCSDEYYYVTVPTGVDLFVKIDGFSFDDYVDIWTYDSGWNDFDQSNMYGYDGAAVMTTSVDTAYTVYTINVMDNECPGDMTGLEFTAWYTTPTEFPLALTSGVATTAKDYGYNGDGDYVYTISGVNVGADLTVSTTATYGDTAIEIEGDNEPSDYCFANDNFDPEFDGFDETCTISSTTDTVGDFTITIGNGTYVEGLIVTAVDSTAGAASETTILNGEGGTTGEITDTNYEYFKINVPSGASNLRVTTSGGTGTSADLYHKYNAQPTTGDYDNRSPASPPNSTNSESILIASPTAGDHYFGVYANGGTVNSVNVTADFTNGSLAKDVDETGITVSEGEWQHYSFSVPAGSTNLTLTTSGGSGNVDLYTRYGAYPTTSTNDGSDTGAGTSKSVVIGSPTSGTYTVSVRGGTGGASNITLNADYTPAPSVLYNGLTETGISGASGEWNYYTVSIPAGSPMLKIVMQDEGANNVEAQLYERYGSNPTTSTYDDADIGGGNDGSITVINPTAGTHHVGVYCHPTGGDCGPVSLTAYFIIDALDLDGGSASNIAVTQPNAWAYYRTHVPFSNYDELIIETTGGTSPSGDVDLYLNFGDFPTVADNDFSSADDNDYTEAINTDPNGGYYYIGLYGSPTFSDIDLTVNMSEGLWVDDSIPTAGTLDVDSTASGDFILSDNVVYKRDVRTWSVDQTLTGSYGNISEDVIYIQNGANIDIYEYNGSSWVNSGDSILGKTLAHAKGGVLVTSGLEVYDCTTLPCTTSVTLSQPVVGVDTPPGDSNPVFNNWPAAIATDGNKIVVTDDLYSTNDPTYTTNGIAYVFDLTGAIEGYVYQGNGGNQFGSSVDIYNDQIIVGERYGFAPGWMSGTGGGTASIFKYTGGNWVFQDEIYPSDACLAQTSGCLFAANDVGIYENYAIAGHPMKNGETYFGEMVYGSGIYLFEKTPGTPDSWDELTKYNFDSDWDFGGEVAITGNYYYAVGGPTPSGGAIILSNNPTGSSGSGGGGAVPEFSDYVLILSLVIAIGFMFKVLPKMGGTPLGRA